MKTYEESVLMIAEIMYYSTMGGGSGRWPTGAGLVAAVYGVSSDKLFEDVHVKLREFYA
jgi:hypothetical protein